MPKKLKWEGLTFIRQAAATFSTPMKCDGCETKVKRAEIFSSKKGKAVWCADCVAIVEAGR